MARYWDVRRQRRGGSPSPGRDLSTVAASPRLPPGSSTWPSYWYSPPRHSSSSTLQGTLYYDWRTLHTDHTYLLSEESSPGFTRQSSYSPPSTVGARGRNISTPSPTWASMLSSYSSRSHPLTSITSIRMFRLWIPPQTFWSIFVWGKHSGLSSSKYTAILAMGRYVDWWRGYSG